MSRGGRRAFVGAPQKGKIIMDLALHHIAYLTHAADVRDADRVNEHRRLAEERRTTERPTRVTEPSRQPVWDRLVEALTLNQARFHRHAH